MLQRLSTINPIHNTASVRKINGGNQFKEKFIELRKNLYSKTPSKIYKTGMIWSNTVTYLKKESTNSTLLNTCKSSIPSPTPMYLTGI